MQNQWGMRGSSRPWLALAVIVFLVFAIAGQATAETVKYYYNTDGSLQKAIYSTKVVKYTYDLSGNRTSQEVVPNAPGISANPGSLAFGTVNAGSSSAAQTVTLTNTGEAALTIQSITVTGTNPTAFAKQTDTCTGQTIQLGTTCTAAAVFQAAGPAGSKSAALTITSNAANTPTLNIPLSGTAACQYSISPITASYSYTAASSSVTVTTQPACVWEAQSSIGWITITNGTGRTGSGTVNYSITQNQSTITRNATVTIAGQDFTIIQGGEPCTYSVSPTSVRFGTAASTLPVTITTNYSSCPWSTTGWPGWASTTTTSGSGTMTVNITTLANTAAATRTATITMAGQQVTVKQGGTADVSKLGVLSDNTWYLDLNGSTAWEAGQDRTTVFGMPAWYPVAGDWTGTGVDRIGAYDAVNGKWYLDLNNTGAWEGAPADRLNTFGFPGTYPIAGDWTGSGVDRIGVYYPQTGAWYLDMNGNGAWDGEPADKLLTFGFAGSLPVVGDWTGSGSVRIGVYDPATSYWYLDMNGNGAWDGEPTDKFCYFGLPGMQPTVGDWTGNGVTRIGVFSSGQWYLDLNGNCAWDGTAVDALIPDFGATLLNVRPVTGKW